MDMLSPLEIIYIKKLLGYLYCLRWQVERFLYKSFFNPLYNFSVFDNCDWFMRNKL